MTDNITTIKDPTVHIKPSEKLITYLRENSESLKENGSEVPENVKKLLKNKSTLLKHSDIEWLNKLLKEKRNEDSNDLIIGKELEETIENILESKGAYFNYAGFVEEKNRNLPYLHDLLEGSEFILPKNEIVKRNPVLAERIEKLKKEQEEREYKAMTQNVDTTKKFIPEDSISYQMNMMNRHLIAVAQFIISVGAGFAFGFLGVELIIGNLNFGVRLLLGISCALIIALAEFYFLAKHLNAEDKEEPKPTPTKSKPKVKAKGKGKNKLHKD